MDLRGYLGARESWRVLGRWKVVDRRTLRTLWELTCRDILEREPWWLRRREKITPRRVALAAALALAFDLPGLVAVDCICQLAIYWTKGPSLRSSKNAFSCAPHETDIFSSWLLKSPFTLASHIVTHLLSFSHEADSVLDQENATHPSYSPILAPLLLYLWSLSLLVEFQDRDSRLLLWARVRFHSRRRIPP